jgi:hypothetical protein
LFSELPPDVQRIAVRNYQLWLANPGHPSLRYRRLQGRDNVVTVRVGDHYRALGLLEADSVAWFWIGSHAEYDRLVRG